MKKVVILGSTGSIGTQALEIISKNKDKFRVVGLSTHQNTDLLLEQVKQFQPEVVVITDGESGKRAVESFPKDIDVQIGLKELPFLAAHPEADTVLNSLVGSIGLEATLSALENGKTLALANKESMVIGGEIINRLSQNKPVDIIPIDSEHSAIFQCLLGEKKEEIHRIVLTSSGGPFRTATKEEKGNATVSQALAHPRWKMGKKISIDSATLMNKGLEVIEAHFLFGLDYQKIDVVIHPQSIIHSMVEFIDGSLKAHLGQTDMRIPVQYALSYPERWPSPLEYTDLVEIGNLTFEKVDYDKFPALKYAYQAGKEGKTYPVVLNGANEKAVEQFLSQNITFGDISKLIKQVLDKHKPAEADNLEDVLAADNWAKEEAMKIIERV